MRSDLWSTSDALSLSLSLVNDDETDERFETRWWTLRYGKRFVEFARSVIDDLSSVRHRGLDARMKRDLARAKDLGVARKRPNYRFLLPIPRSH